MNAENTNGAEVTRAVPIELTSPDRLRESIAQTGFRGDLIASLIESVDRALTPEAK